MLVYKSVPNSFKFCHGSEYTNGRVIVVDLYGRWSSKGFFIFVRLATGKTTTLYNFPLHQPKSFKFDILVNKISRSESITSNWSLQIKSDSKCTCVNVIFVRLENLQIAAALVIFWPTCNIFKNFKWTCGFNSSMMVYMSSLSIRSSETLGERFISQSTPLTPSYYQFLTDKYFNLFKFVNLACFRSLKPN
jgi:hypothetical protein